MMMKMNISFLLIGVFLFLSIHNVFGSNNNNNNNIHFLAIQEEASEDNSNRSGEGEDPLIFMPESSTAGFRTTLTQRGINYIKDVGMIFLQQALANLQINGQAGTAGTPIGKVDWDLKNIVLNKITFPTTAITLVPGSGLTLAMSNAGGHVGLKWHYRKKHWPHVSDHGTADINFSQLSASVTLEVTQSNGRPHLNVKACSVHIGNLSIKLHGGASWLYNFFIKILHGKIVSAVQNALQGGITKNINNGVNSQLATLPIAQPISKEVEIDFPLVANPQFAAKYLSILQLGEFYQIGHKQECPAQYCPASPLPEPSSNEMVQMTVSDFLVNSAGFVFWKLGKLAVTIRDSDLPSWSPIRLNTTSFKALLPALYNLYPNQALDIVIASNPSPNVVFSSKGATVTAPGTLTMNVLTKNGTTIPVFVLKGQVQTSGAALLSGLTLYANLTYINANFTLQSSLIGPFNPAIFNDLINTLFSRGIVPALNILLKSGFTLPTVQGVTFVKPQLQWGSHFLHVSTDINYNPPHNFQLEQELPSMIIPDEDINNNNNNNTPIVIVDE